jgi:hypothetical protein
MKKQAISFGAQIDELKEILEIELTGKKKYIKTDDTKCFSDTVIIASGANPRELDAVGTEVDEARANPKIEFCLKKVVTEVKSAGYSLARCFADGCVHWGLLWN